MEVRGQITGLGSLPPCGSQGPKLGRRQPWQQTPLPLSHLAHTSPDCFFVVEGVRQLTIIYALSHRATPQVFHFGFLDCWFKAFYVRLSI